MNALIQTSKPGGSLTAIPSKSDAHRLLIAAALAEETTRLALSKSSADIKATAACLSALGGDISETAEGFCVNPIVEPAKAPSLDCGESGTTLRLLLPVAAALGNGASFAGRGRLPERPIGELLDCLLARGVSATSARLPLTLMGRLEPGVYEIAGNVSSQYISGLLLALPILKGDSEIRLTSPLESIGYVRMTMGTLDKFGVRAEGRENGFSIPGSQQYRSPGALAVEGDWSNAAVFLAAGALFSPVRFSGLALDSKQPDRNILELLRRFGARVEEGEGAVSVAPGPLRGIAADVSQTPDLVPVLAVLGALAEGETRLYNAARLRIKESDRLATSTAMLRALGARVEELPDALVITGGPLAGGSVDCANDHRIVMAGALAGCAAKGETTLVGAECVSKSYPSFFEDFTALGGRTNVISLW